MKKIINIIAAFAIAMGLYSCEDFFAATVVIEAPEHTPRLVVHSILDMQYPEFVSVTVGESRGLFEEVSNDETTTITDATVELYRNGELYTTLDTITSLSTLEYGALNETDTLEVGATYELRVSHPDFEPVSATQTIPVQVPYRTATYNTDGETSEFGDSSAGLIEITLDDPAGENFYEFSVLFADTLDDGSLNYYQSYFETSDQNIERGIDYSSGLITDRTFAGQAYTMRLNYFNWDFVNGEPVSRDVFIYWRTVTKDYYEYSTSSNRARETQGNPFAEPVGLYTNIDGGFGFFGAANGKIYPAVEE